jgi:hypothetical protein
LVEHVWELAASSDSNTHQPCPSSLACCPASSPAAHALIQDGTSHLLLSPTFAQLLWEVKSSSLHAHCLKPVHSPASAMDTLWNRHCSTPPSSAISKSSWACVLSCGSFKLPVQCYPDCWQAPGVYIHQQVICRHELTA